MVSSWHVAKQGVSLLFHLLGYFYASICLGARFPLTNTSPLHKLARHALFSFGSSMLACEDLSHSGATCSAID